MLSNTKKYLSTDLHRRNHYIFKKRKYSYLLTKDRGYTKSSVIVELGGYRGRWAEEMYKKYGCTVHIFEPSTYCYMFCFIRLCKFTNIKLHKYGISSVSGTSYLTLAQDGSSLCRKSTGLCNVERAYVKSYVDAVRSEGITNIDILQVNIEGLEYAVLPQIVHSGFIKNIRFLQIQFHPKRDADIERTRIHELLARTHTLRFDVPFVWEGWERNKT